MSDDTQIALVTGASQGVGRGIALGLARAGWHVGINYHRNQAGAEQVAALVQAAGQRSWLLRADVGDARQAAAMFEQLVAQAGRLDLLVNNAGRQTWAPLLELSAEDWEHTIRTNLTGTFLCTQQAARLMKEAGHGRIVNIGSGANKAPFPYLSDYCASKGGIQTFTVVAAVELGRYGITVNCVAPGTIEIERTRLENPDYAGTWGSLTPLGRIGHVEDVADAVVFLASEQARFITAQTLYVDGGLWSQVPWAYSKSLSE